MKEGGSSTDDVTELRGYRFGNHCCGADGVMSAEYNSTAQYGRQAKGYVEGHIHIAPSSNDIFRRGKGYRVWWVVDRT